MARRGMLAPAIVVALTEIASAEQSARPVPPLPVSIVFDDVQVVSMESDCVEAGKAVVVIGDRIATIADRAQVTIPTGAIIVNGGGRYLLPGLIDSHVHLTEDMPWAHTRPEFGDAAIYLAYGVTTVVNLRGTPNQLAWRQRINDGTLLGPTIYTAGEFINEPRLTTADEVRRDILAQHRSGYDLIKFHELPRTTTGLSADAYESMVRTATEVGLPLVGHAPFNLGLDQLLSARQPLAHVGMLTNIYFRPVPASLYALAVTGATVLGLLLVVGTSAVVAIVRRRRGNRQPPSAAIHRLRSFTRYAAAIGLIATVALFHVLPGAPLVDYDILRVAVTACAVLLLAITALLLKAIAGVWRVHDTEWQLRGQAVIVAVVSVTLALTLSGYWTPIVWRSSDAGLSRFAQRIRDAGIPVQTTLVVYDLMTTKTRVSLMQDEAIGYLRADTREAWRALPPEGLPFTSINHFNQKVVGALHRAGVTIVAGTDAMGMPLIPPGSSLHRELALLRASGLTPYEALRASTITAATFLRRENEFGTIAVGKRADLLLIEGNPLEDLGRLKQPAGVMVRGNWLPREQLQRLLSTLR